MVLANGVIIILSFLFYTFYRIRYYLSLKFLSQSQRSEMKNTLSLLSKSQKNKYYKWTIKVYKFLFYYQIIIIGIFILTTNDVVAEAGIWLFLALIPFHVFCFYQYKNIQEDWKNELKNYPYQSKDINRITSIYLQKYLFSQIGIYGKIAWQIPYLFKSEDKK